VIRCLERRPQNRFESVAAFRQTLDLFMASQGIWVNHAERLAGYLQAQEGLQEEPSMTSVDISVSDLLKKSTPVGKPPGRTRHRMAAVMFTTALVGALLWVAYGMGWLSPVLAALGLE